MTDRLTDYAAKSLARLLDEDVSTFDKVYVVTKDFDWNKKPDPTQPGEKFLDRDLPFAAVQLQQDEITPFSISNNILWEPKIDLMVHVCGRTYTEMVQLTADAKQVIITASNAGTGSIGVTLYNFAVASGSFFATAGTLQPEVGITQYFGPEDPQMEDNREYKSITPVRLSAYKDATATLLENQGRINLTDS